MASMTKELKGALIVGFFLIIVGQLAPFFGGTLESATPTLGTTSEWNATYNTDLPSTADIWGNILTIAGAGITLYVIIVVAKPFIGEAIGKM